MSTQDTVAQGPDAPIDTSYEPFSREPEYIEANRAFVRALPLHRDMRIVDLACGTGTMTDLILETLFAPEGWDGRAPRDRIGDSGVRIVGLDLSRESLLLCREHLGALGVAGSEAGAVQLVDLVEGSAERLPLRDASADLAIMGNAIQLVEDRGAMFAELARVLRPGARFAFNTSFYAGSYTPGTEHVYIRWVQEAVSELRREDAARKARGEPGIARVRGTAARAFSRPWLSAEEYGAEMAEAGLAVESVNDRTVMLDQRCFETIGAYAGLAKVLLSGYPVARASEALVRAAGPTLAAVGMIEVPRYWLEMVVRKPA